MKLVLWSAPDREDIVSGYYKFQSKVWPHCPYEIVPMTGDTNRGWTKRLLEFLKGIPDEVIMFNGDDFYPVCYSGGMVNEDFARIEEIVRTDPSVGSAILDYNENIGAEYKDFPRFKIFGKGRVIDHSCLAPIIAKKKFMVDVSEYVLTKITKAQDVGWAGMYNWELYGCQKAVEWNVLGTEQPVHYRLNAVRQNKWMPDTPGVCTRLGIDIDFATRGFYTGINPGVDTWEKASKK